MATIAAILAGLGKVALVAGKGALAAGKAGAAVAGKGALAAGKGAAAIGKAGAAKGGSTNPLHLLGQQLGARAAQPAGAAGLSSLPPTASAGGIGTAGGSTVPFGLTGSLPSSSIGLGANPALAPPGAALPVPGATTPGSLLGSLGPQSGPSAINATGIPGQGPDFGRIFQNDQVKQLLGQQLQGAGEQLGGGGGGDQGGGGGGGVPVAAPPSAGLGTIGPSAGPVPQTGAEGFGGAGTELAQLLSSFQQQPQQGVSGGDSEFIKRLLAQGVAGRALGGGF